MKHGLQRVHSCEVVGPHALSLGFDDGTRRTIDFEPILRGELYGPLRDPQVFALVKVDSLAGTIVWPNGADFDPAMLHDWSAHREDFISAARHWETPTAKVAEP
jgi:hypothetical protein